MKAPSVVGASKFSQYSNRLNRLGSRDISGIYINNIYLQISQQHKYKKQNQKNIQIYIEQQYKILIENKCKINSKINQYIKKIQK